MGWNFRCHPGVPSSSRQTSIVPLPRVAQGWHSAVCQERKRRKSGKNDPFCWCSWGRQVTGEVQCCCSGPGGAGCLSCCRENSTLECLCLFPCLARRGFSGMASRDRICTEPFSCRAGGAHLLLGTQSPSWLLRGWGRHLLWNGIRMLGWPLMKPFL